MYVRRKGNEKNVTGIIWGICIVLLGVIALLKIFNMFNFNLLFDGWWALFIIIPSMLGLIFDKEKLSSIFFLILGIFLMCAANNLIEYNEILKVMICVAIILIGIRILISSIFGKKPKIPNINSNDMPNYTGIFGSASEKISKTKFSGCNIQTIFGSVDLDLRDAVIEKDICIKSINIFGGTDIRIPDGINVVTSGINICGGTDSKKRNDNAKSSTTIYIKTVCIFGGVEVK